MKKLVSLLLALTILAGCFYIGASVEEEKELKLGDYITLGKYNGEDIVWRYVADDENGKLMFSDEILCRRAYDSGEGEGDERHKQHLGYYGNVLGSSRWSNSNIRSWLNSDANLGEVVWLCNIPPSDEEERNEKGFLHSDNFSDSEKSLIKTVMLNTALDVNDYEFKDGGEELNRGELTILYHTELNDDFYEKYRKQAYETVEERIFLLDIEQLAKIKENADMLFKSDYDVFSKSFLLRSAYSGIAYHDQGDMDWGCYVHFSDYWTKYEVFNIARQATFVKGDIVPAFYLNEENAQILSGNGTKEDPYVIDGKKEENALKLGDYITLGKYNGEDIVWRYVADDENGKLFWSDKFICEKPFGENDQWEKSPLREWLNSDEQFMNIESQSGYKYIEEIYNSSHGFLYDSNFTEAEKSLIKEVSLRSVYLNDYWGLFTGKLASYGVKKSFWDEEDEANREYYLNLESTMLTEKVFLLDLEQMLSVQKNMNVLGNYFIGIESMSGDADNDDGYFTRTPLDGGYITGSHPLEAGYHGRILTIDNSISERYIDRDFVQDAYSHTSVNYFVRPAFYLNEENAMIFSGKGTADAPYVVDGKSAPQKFEENGLYGYKDAEGNVIVPAKFLKAGDFYENAALVILPEDPYRLRFIDTEGNYLFDKAFYAVNNFSSGYALTVANEKGEYTYIDKTGEAATELRFEYAENFDRGFARVIHHGQSGVIDTLFNFYPDEICEDYSVVKGLEGYKVTFNSKGNTFFEKVYKNEPAVAEVKDGIYKITYRHYYNYDAVQFVDVNNEKLSPREYSDIIYNNGEYAASKSMSRLYIYDIFSGEAYEIRRNFASDNTHLEIAISNNTVHLIYAEESGRYSYNIVEEDILLTDELKIK